MATATGCVPTAIGELGTEGIEDAAGGTETLKEEKEGPLATSVFWRKIGSNPGVIKSEPERFTLNCRLLWSTAGRDCPWRVADVEEEKYPPMRLTEPDGEFSGMLSGLEETTAGRVGCTDRVAVLEVPPF